jgi:hypothetical protein
LSKKLFYAILALVALVGAQATQAPASAQGVVQGVSIIVVRQASLQMAVSGPDLVDADNIITLTLHLRNTGSSSVYNLNIDVKSSTYIKVLSVDPASVGTLAPGKETNIVLKLYVMPYATGYQVVTITARGNYPDGSEVSVSAVKGFLVTSTKTSTVLVKLEKTIACVGMWNPIPITIVNYGNYTLKDVVVNLKLVSCNGVKYNGNVACIVSTPVYVKEIAPNSAKKVNVNLYVAPYVSVQKPLSIAIMVTFNELGHKLIVSRSVTSVNALVPVYCTG